MNHKNTFIKSGIIATIFTAFDYISHTFLKSLEITSYPFQYYSTATPIINYAISKLLFTFIALVILFYVFNYFKSKPAIQYGVSLVLIIGFLQVRYMSLNSYYTSQFHTLNLINHIITYSIAFWSANALIKK